NADRWILRIPFYREIVLARGNFITLYGLAMLVKSGVNQSDALLLAQDTASKGALRNDLKLAYTEVKAGRPWAKVMHTLHPTDKAALLSALDNEQVARTLMNLANQYKEIYAQRLNTFVPALTLLSALLLTIAGGILFGEVILPMLQASNGMLGG
ncbi:type II secretion system F family protein, partial [Acidithiobacillus thiooxidans]